MRVADVIDELGRKDRGPIAYSVCSGELTVGNLAVGRKPFGYDWPDGKWCVYFCTKRESYDVLLFDSESEACENFLSKVLRESELRRRYGKITKSDVKIELDQAGVDPGSYSLNGSNCGDFYVLEGRPDGKWTVSFTERGSRSEIALFDSESEAAIHLLDRALVAKERQDRNRAGKGRAGGPGLTDPK
jgi:hypothetical protein